MLRVEGVTQILGGFRALHEVSLQVGQGEIVALIGANGAGKTTLFNVISGVVHATEGKVFLNARDITRQSPQAIVRSGVARSFQRSSIFERLTVSENIEVALRNGNQGQYNSYSHSTILESVGLNRLSKEKAETLSLGDKKRLEIGIIIALKPKLLLLDEPTAGMSPSETMEIIQLITRIATEENISVLFTEHDMDVVFAVAQRIYVLHQGGIISEGTPTQVQSDIRVQTVYLGQGQ